MDETVSSAANDEADLLQQYLVPAPVQSKPPPDVQMPAATIPTPPSSNTTTTPEASFDTFAPIFQGLKFYMHGFCEESEDELQTEIENYGGQLVPTTCKSVIDYLLVPTDVMHIDVKLRATHTVNEYWIVSIYAKYCINAFFI